MKIKLSHCTIRSLQKADATSIAKYADNIHVWNNVRDMFPYPYTLADAEKFIEFSLSQNPICNFAIEVNGEAVGVIGIVLNSDIHRISAEIGYWLGESFWGKGIMTEAVRAFVEYAFQTYEIHRIFAGVFSFNEASAKVLEKAGFVHECTHKEAIIKNGKIGDELIYAKLSSRRFSEI